jgi:transketolase C-terminal domain/subunit
MNQRIKELAEQINDQASDVFNGKADGMVVTREDLEKFAELIIEECAKLAEYNGYNQMFGQGGLRTKLQEYFRIEEKGIK